MKTSRAGVESDTAFWRRLWAAFEVTYRRNRKLPARLVARHSGLSRSQLYQRLEWLHVDYPTVRSHYLAAKLAAKLAPAINRTPPDTPPSDDWATMPRLSIDLPDGALHRLQELAGAERRDVRDQATVLVESALARIAEPTLAPLAELGRRATADAGEALRAAATAAVAPVLRDLHNRTTSKE